MTIVCVTSPAAGGSTFTGYGEEYGGGPAPAALGDVSSSDTSARAFASGEAGKSLGGITLLSAGTRGNNINQHWKTERGGGREGYVRIMMTPSTLNRV